MIVLADDIFNIHAKETCIKETRTNDPKDAECQRICAIPWKETWGN